jgi:hypothetical protein
MGPVGVGLIPGITDNAQLSSSFDGFVKRTPQVMVLCVAAPQSLATPHSFRSAARH